MIEVNSRSVSAKEFATELLDRFRSLDSVSLNDSNYLAIVKDQIVQDFILNLLIESYAQEQNITVSDADLTEEIQKNMKDYPDELAFRQNLLENGLSFEAWKKSLKQNLLTKKITMRIEASIVEPSEEELAADYARNKDQFQRRSSIHLKQIVLRDESSAKLLHSSLAKGQLTFEDAAKKYSIAPEGQTGGIVGWVFENEIEAFQPAFSLATNKLSEVHKSSVGFHLFLVTDKRKSGLMPYDDVKQQIRTRVMEQRKQAKFTEWLDLRLRVSRVSINEELVKSMVIEVRDQL